MRLPWNAAALLAMAVPLAMGQPALAQSYSLAVQSAQASPGQTVDVRIVANNIPAISGVSFSLLFDQSSPSGQPLPQASQPTAGDLLGANSFVEANTDQPGRISVATAVMKPVQGTGVLVLIPITVPANATPGAVYPLSLQSVDMTDANLRPLSPALQNGSLTVAQAGGPNAATVTVTPSSAQVVFGGKTTFQATVRDATGAVIQGAPVVWSVAAGANGGGATITQTGELTGTAPGDVVVTATSGQAVGTASVRVLSAAPTVTVSVGSVAGAAGTRVVVPISIGPASSVAGVDLTLSYATVQPPGSPALIPQDAERGPIATQVVLTTTKTTPGVVRFLMASASGFGGPGVMLQVPFDVPAGVQGGTTYALKVTSVAMNDASGNPISVSAQDGAVSVQGSTVGPVANVTVSPGSATVPMGATVQFSATARDASGSIISSPQITWSTTAGTGAGVVDATGLFTPTAVGTAAVSATIGGITGTAQVNITAPTPANNVRVDTVTAIPGAMVAVPIYVSQSTFNGANILIDYSSVSPAGAPPLTLPTDSPISTAETLTFRAFVGANTRTSGQIRIGVISADPIVGPGTLVKLMLNVPTNAPDGAVYGLRVVSAELDDLTGVALPSSGTDGAVRVVVDRTPPSVAITSPTPGSVLRNPITIAGTAIDDRGPVARVELYADGGTTPIAAGAQSPFSFALSATALLDGQHTLVAKAIDASGNVGQSSPLVITVDNTPPSVQIVGVAPGQYVGGTLSISANVTDLSGGVSAELRLDGGASPVATASGPPFAMGLDTTRYKDGQHTIEVAVTDKAGNVGRSSLAFQIDNTPPVVTLSGPPAGTPVRATVPVSALVSDAGGVASAEATLDGTSVGKLAVPPYTFSVDTTKVADGQHTVVVAVTDLAGNVGSAQMPLIVDNTPPTVTLSGPQPGQYVRGSFTLAVAVGQSDVVSRVELRADGAQTPVASLTSPPFSFTMDTSRYADGQHTFEVSATDLAGNVGKASLTVMVDNTAPTAVIASPSPLQEVSGKLSVTGTASSGTQASFDGYTLEYGQGDSPTAYQPIGARVTTPVTSGTLGQLDLSGLAPGVYTLRLTVTDKAGNSTVTTVSFRVAATPSVVRGDLNGDGKVAVSDAAIALRISVGLRTATQSELAAGDLNGDGAVSVAEATRILRYAVGLIASL